MPDGNYGKYQQGRSRVLSYTLGAPALGTNTAVHAAVTDTGVQQVVTTGITNPDVARNITATSGGTSADIKAVSVTVAGTNIWGDAITEVLPVFTVNSATTVVGLKAFATVTSITIPAHDGTGATTAVGTAVTADLRLGLPVTLPRKTFVNLFVDDVVDTIADSAVDSDEVEKNWVEPTTAADGTKVFVLDYYK
jgi:hypothetical protein